MRSRMIRSIAWSGLGLLLLGSNASAQESTNNAPAHARVAGENADRERKSNARILLDQARADLHAGRLVEAEGKLRAALEIDPNFRAASYYLTLVLERRAIHQKASAEPIFPVIKKLDGTLHYGMPVHKRALREVADDLNAK